MCFLLQLYSEFYTTVLEKAVIIDLTPHSNKVIIHYIRNLSIGKDNHNKVFSGIVLYISNCTF